MGTFLGRCAEEKCVYIYGYKAPHGLHGLSIWRKNGAFVASQLAIIELDNELAYDLQSESWVFASEWFG